MALLAAVRYWQGNETPVSELLIRLRDISKSDDYIQLPRLTSLADLDDAAFGLGYSLTILPADPSAARKLIEAGIPVLLPVYQTFYLIYGFDDSRGIVNALCFGQLSEKTQSLAVKEAQEVLMLESEGQGRTKDQLSRIKREAECMWHLSHWQTGRLQDAAPFMAAIHPEDGRKAVAAALGREPQDLTVSHRGLLSALIALSHFDAADPINCIRWSQIASGSIDDPLVWQTAYLGATLWQHRTQRIGSALQLEKRFDLLNEVNQFLQTESVKRLLDPATEKFAEDLAADRLNWPIRWRLLWLLDRNDVHQRRQMVSLLNANLATHPADAAQWRLLADLQALNHNPAARAQALAQAWSADPRDPATALSWASACILLDDPAKADQILAKIDPAKVRHQADYFFCLAAVAEWKHQPKAALRYYAKATDMCRYRSEYYLRYGRLLLAQGDAAAGKKAMAWAARIDSGEKIGQAATHDPEPQAR
jgi:hypothetical protein